MEHQLTKKRLYAVICVYHPLEYTNQKFTNHMLEKIQMELKEELSNYKEIQVAYVYETPMLDVKEFGILNKNTPIYYKEPCIGEKHNLAHVLFMGLILLQNLQKEHKKKNEYNDSEYRLYLLTEDEFKRSQVNQIVYKENGDIKIHPFFENVVYRPILLKTINAGGDILEEYFKRQGSLYPAFEDTSKVGVV